MIRRAAILIGVVAFAMLAHRGTAARAARESAVREVQVERPAVVVAAPVTAAAASAIPVVHDASLDEFYGEGFVTDVEAYVGSADRSHPRVEGTVPFQGAFVVEVVHAMRVSELSVLFKDGTGRFMLWLAPGQYHVRARGRDGVLTSSVTVAVSGPTTIKLTSAR